MWRIASIGLLPVMFLCAILTTVILDTMIVRPVPASITTLLPGVAYATALIMKVCIAEWLLLVVVTLVNRKRPDKSQGMPNATWAIISVALTPLAPLVAGIGVLIAQALVAKPDGLSLSYFPTISRTGVLVCLTCVFLGAAAAIIALARRERPRLLPVVSLITNVFLIVMFRYFHFYKLGFDQDRWAGP